MFAIIETNPVRRRGGLCGSYDTAEQYQGEIVKESDTCITLRHFHRHKMRETPIDKRAIRSIQRMR